MSTGKNGFDNEKYIKEKTVEILKRVKCKRLNLEEALIVLSISATTKPAAELALEKLKELQYLEVHMTHIHTPGDEAGLRHMGVNLTTYSNFSTNNLFIS